MDFPVIMWIGAGVGVLALTFVAVMWTRAAQSAFTAPGDVLRKRSLTRFIIFGILTAIVLFVLPSLAYADADSRQVIVGLGLLVTAPIWLINGATEVAFWGANDQGVTHQALFFKKTLPWQSIDWVYPTTNTTNIRQYGIKTASIVHHGLMVEAGPKVRMKITLGVHRNTLGWRQSTKKGIGDEILRVIQQRATNAIFGFDQYPAVRQRREQMGYPRR